MTGRTAHPACPRDCADTCATRSNFGNCLVEAAALWSKELLHDTLAAPDPSGKIALLVEKDDQYKTLELQYPGGERYPNLQRVPGTADLLLSNIAQSRASPTAP
jgi:hypothetical protein